MLWTAAVPPKGALEDAAGCPNSPAPGLAGAAKAWKGPACADVAALCCANGFEVATLLEAAAGAAAAGLDWLPRDPKDVNPPEHTAAVRTLSPRPRECLPAIGMSVLPASSVTQVLLGQVAMSAQLDSPKYPVQSRGL